MAKCKGLKTIQELYLCEVYHALLGFDKNKHSSSGYYHDKLQPIINFPASSDKERLDIALELMFWLAGDTYKITSGVFFSTVFSRFTQLVRRYNLDNEGKMLIYLLREGVRKYFKNALTPYDSLKWNDIIENSQQNWKNVFFGAEEQSAQSLSNDYLTGIDKARFRYFKKYRKDIEVFSPTFLTFLEKEDPLFSPFLRQFSLFLGKFYLSYFCYAGEQPYIDTFFKAFDKLFSFVFDLSIYPPEIDPIIKAGDDEAYKIEDVKIRRNLSGIDVSLVCILYTRNKKYTEFGFCGKKATKSNDQARIYDFINLLILTMGLYLAQITKGKGYSGWNEFYLKKESWVKQLVFKSFIHASGKDFGDFRNDYSNILHSGFQKLHTENPLYWFIRKEIYPLWSFKLLVNSKWFRNKGFYLATQKETKEAIQGQQKRREAYQKKYGRIQPLVKMEKLIHDHSIYYDTTYKKTITIPIWWDRSTIYFNIEGLDNNIVFKAWSGELDTMGQSGVGYLGYATNMAAQIGSGTIHLLDLFAGALILAGFFGGFTTSVFADIALNDLTEARQNLPKKMPGTTKSPTDKNQWGAWAIAEKGLELVPYIPEIRGLKNKGTVAPIKLESKATSEELISSEQRMIGGGDKTIKKKNFATEEAIYNRELNDLLNITTDKAKPLKPTKKRPSIKNYEEFTSFYPQLDFPKEAWIKFIKKLGGKNHVARRSQQGELEALIRILDNKSLGGRKVKKVRIIPENQQTRTPDFVLEYEDGWIERVEIRTLTAAPIPKLKIPSNSLELHKITQEKLPDIETLKAALRDKGSYYTTKGARREKSKKIDGKRRWVPLELQLGSELADVRRGGVILIPIQRGKNLPPQKIKEVIEEIGGELDVLVERVEILLPSGNFMTFERQGEQFVHLPKSR